MIKSILSNATNSIIADNIINSYEEIEQNFTLSKWKPSELDAGHFVESARRFLEYIFNHGKYTPFNKKLAPFSVGVITQYEQNTHVDDTYRKHIPRVLWAMYHIRNNRGVGHVASISPNRMDATYILHSAKWVLSEIIRMNSNYSASQSQELVDQISARQISLLWKGPKFEKVLNRDLPAWKQVLVLLHDEDQKSEVDLRSSVENKNTTDFRNKVLGSLHEKGLIHYDPESGICHISPLGIKSTEEIIQESKL
jgi:hypothetical protein